MKRSRLAVLLVVLAASLSAPPKAMAVDEVRYCVERAVATWQQAPAYYAERFIWESSTCARHYADRLRSMERIEDYRACMRRAIATYQFITGIEQPVHFTILCLESYLQTSFYRP